MGHHYQQHHPGMVAINNPVTSMGHMMEMMSQRQQAPPLQHHHQPNHHHHHHPQLPAPPLTYQQRCHAPPPQHLGSSHSHQLHQSANVPHAQAHQSPPSHLHQGSPPAPPLSAQVWCFVFTDQLNDVTSNTLFIRYIEATLKMLFVYSYHRCHSKCSLPSMQCRQAVAAVVEEEAATVAGGQQSRTQTSAGRSFWNVTELRPPAADRRGKCGCRRWRRKLKSWRTQTCSYRWDTLCKLGVHANVSYTSKNAYFSVCSQNEVTSLRSEVGQLKQILLTHKDCPVTARQREAQGYPSE